MKPPSVQGKWIGTGAIVVLLAVAAGALSFVWREHLASKKPKVEAKAGLKVFTGTQVSLAGRIEARKVEQIPVPVAGKVETFYVEVGAEVYEGQLLAQVRSEALESEQQAAQMTLEQEETKVNDLEASISSVRLEASRARAEASRAQSDYDRASKAYQRQRMLMAEGATPRLVFEKAEKDYATAKSEYENLEQVAKQGEERVSAIVRDLDNARKQLQHASQDAETAKQHLATGEVHSPVNGIVVGRRGELGGAVDPSMRNLFDIATDLSQLEVIADVPSDVLPRLKTGQAATIRVAEVPGEGLGGVVANVQDGRVVVEFGNPNPLVKPGLTAQVVIEIR